MSNMSYCRFENTLSDLIDCRDALRDCELEEFQEQFKDDRYANIERRKAVALYEVCKEIVELVENGETQLEERDGLKLEEDEDAED